MASIFTRIINREIPAYIVAEDENHIAFLDVFPLVRGHTLVIPKKEVDNIFDLDSELYQSLFLFAQNVAKGIASCTECVKVGMAVVGLEVPHAHIHLVPVKEVGDMNFSRAKLALSKEELEEVRAMLAASISL